jgi:serine/threonine protein kinase
MASSDTRDLTGQTIASQFQVLRKLGAGGMGAVYLAEQLDMGRKVVIKVMHPELTNSNMKAVERFKREARSVAQLNHPHIVQVYVFGSTGVEDQLYQAMEFVDGKTLNDLMKEVGRIPQPRVLRILDQTCSALVEAHGGGIVHRDLKPDNIMLTDRHGNPDYVKVLDFGIAKLMGEQGQQALTQAGAVFGTPRYMAPEQAKGGSVDARSDIYALGVMAYEMLAGKHPFEANTALDFLVKHTTEPVILPSARFQDLEIQPRPEAILARCLEKDPAKRFQSAAEMQREVRLALRDFPDGARAHPTPGRPVEPLHSPPTAPTTALAGSHGKLAIFVSGTVLALVAIVVAIVMATQTDSTGASDADTSTSKNTTVASRADSNATQTDTSVAPKDELKSKNDTSATQPSRDTSKASKVADAKKASPTTLKPPKLKVGKRVEGFPLPSDARVTTETPQALIVQTKHDPLETLNFYKYHLAKSFGGYKTMPNGLQVKGQKSPFNFVYLQATGMGLNIVLNRNIFYKKKATGITTEDTFGVAMMPGARLVVRTAITLTYTLPGPRKKVFDYYESLYRKNPKIRIYRLDTGQSPVMSINGLKAKTQWLAISLLNDPQNPGNVYLSIQKRQQ